MLKKDKILQVVLIVLSLMTILSLIYVKLIIVPDSNSTSYFPFFKSMTYLEYAGYTAISFFEFVAIVSVSVIYMFLIISRMNIHISRIFLILGILELVIILFFGLNIVIFNLVHQDIHIYVGWSGLLILATSIIAIWYGFPKRNVESPIEREDRAVPENDIQPLNEILKFKREANNLTQQELADKIQVSRQTIHRWESGKSHPDMEYMIAVATALQFPVTDFWGGNDDQVNVEIGNVVDRGNRYKVASYFLLTIVLISFLISSIAFLGRNLHSPYLDYINPFIEEKVGYSLVTTTGSQKVAVIDNDIAEGSVITLNGYSKGKNEFVKVVHKGAYVKSENRAVPRADVPIGIRNNLYDVSHFNDPSYGLKKVQQSYVPRT